MKTLLLCLLLAAIPQPSVPKPETFRQELIMKYPVLATEKRPEAVLTEIRDTKTRVREMIALQDDMPVADDMLANAELLATADRLTERLPGTFEHILHAASLYDIMRAECFNDNAISDGRIKELYGLFFRIAENLYSLAFSLASTTDQIAVSATSLAEIRIRERHYGYNIMPLYRECYAAATTANYKVGILERMISYLSDYKNPVPEERIKVVLPYKKMLADLIVDIQGLTADYKAGIISDCARYCALALDDDAGYYFNKAVELEKETSMPPFAKQLGRIINGREFVTDPTVNFALGCDDYSTAMNAMKSLGMILDENNFYTYKDIYENRTETVRYYQFSEAYPVFIATLAKIKSRFGKEDADKYRTEAFLSAARIIQYDISAKSRGAAESRLRFLVPAIVSQYGNSDPRLAYDAALLMKQVLTGEYDRFYRYSDILDSLEENEWAIEFVNYFDDRSGEEVYDALILSKCYSEPFRVNICHGRELSSLCAKDQKIYENELYGLIWERIENHIPAKGRILFSPSGLLNIVNIEAAQDENGRRACDIWHIRRLTSTKQTCMPETPYETFSKAAIFGNTDELRYTQYEVKHTDSLMYSKRILTKVFIGDECTEKNLMACTYDTPDIIHIAAHAFFLDNDTIPAPLQSGLILSGERKPILGINIPGDNTDDIVFAREIAGISMGNCRLVVLSACGTGLGYIMADGVSGLQTAFKQAGAKTIVMSLWNINDMITSRLMTEFYRHLTSGMDAHEAMYKAQDTIRKTAGYSHPYYWAGFIVAD